MCKIQRYPKLTSLHVDGCEFITDKSILSILDSGKASELVELDLAMTQITDKSLLHVCKMCPKLKKIIVSYCSITDESVVKIAETYPELVTFIASGCSSLTDVSSCKNRGIVSKVGRN